MPETTPVTASPNGQVEVADPKNTGSIPKAETKVEEATEVIKVNGKEMKFTKAQVTALAQKGFFADQKLKSMDVLQSTTSKLIEKLKTPEGLLEVLSDKALGTSKKDVFRKLMASDVIDDELKEEMSKWVYDNVVQKSKLTPEQIENEKKLSDYERLKKAEEDRKQKEMSEAQKTQLTNIYQAIRAEVTKQITADKTFPQTEGSIRAVVEKLRVMNKQGVPITVENIGKALNFVKKDHLLHQQTMFDAIEDPEALIALFGEERALKISRALVARIKAKEKAKAKEEKPIENGVREKVTDRIDKKLGRTQHGYQILDV